MSTVSAIILTANRCRLLEVCLRALARQERRPDELVVVENGSTDDTRAMLERVELPFPLRVVEHGGKGSYAEARQAGLNAATAELVWFVDDDCEADSTALARLLEAMEANGWVAVGGALLPAEELEAPPEYAPELCWAAGLLPAEFFGPLGGRRVLPATANLLFRRELAIRFPFQEIGGAAGDYLTGREDAQWWRQLRRAGEPVGVAPRAIAWHHIPAERLQIEQLRDRARSDGQAHWRRERLHAEVEAAASDVVHAPINAIREFFTSDLPPAQAWEKHFTWARRQQAFLDSAIDDFEHQVAPLTRLKAYLKGTAKVAASVAKPVVRLGATAAFGSFATPRPVPTVEAPPRRLLVVLHDFLGDTVLALPMLRQLREAFPEANIHIAAGEQNAPILEAALDGSVRLEVVPRNARGRSPRAAWQLHQFLAPLEPDVVLVAYCHGLHPAPLFLLDQAPVIAWTHDNGFQQQVWGEWVAAPVEKNWEKSEVAALLDLLGPLGIRARVERPAFVPRERARERAAAVLREAKTERGRYAVLHLEASRRSKVWPAERMREVAERLVVEEGLTVFLVGSRGDRPTARRHAAKVPSCHVLHGLLDAEELGALLEGARLFTGPDSGPAHVAQAVRCPSVLLFGATEVHRWGPLPAMAGEQPPAAVVLAAAPGNWLAEETHGLPANEAMRLLGSEKVWRGIKTFLNS